MEVVGKRDAWNKGKLVGQKLSVPVFFQNARATLVATGSPHRR